MSEVEGEDGMNPLSWVALRLTHATVYPTTSTADPAIVVWVSRMSNERHWKEGIKSICLICWDTQESTPASSRTLAPNS